MAWVWDKRTMQMHDLSKRTPQCGIDDLPKDQGKVYEDEHTATTVVKTQHLIPCRFCYRPTGRSQFPAPR
ncbi:MAG TPA: hypothetical protein VGR28_01630 [Candidatus Thermoplasmatota archaeon]|jgi:hypothetical protein|nr:hypothetical protein [Candidatus Thermoplasmatota archaeon]